MAKRSEQKTAKPAAKTSKANRPASKDKKPLPRVTLKDAPARIVRKTFTRTHIWLMTGLLSIVALVVASFVFHQILVDAGKVPVAERVTLSSEYYGNASVTERIDGDTLNQMAADQKSFVIYISYPICSEETAEFKQYVYEYAHKADLKIFEITTDKISGTPIKDNIQYFPTVAVFEKGAIKNYLHFDKDEDTVYYKSLDGLTKWIEANVELKN